jgi:hypothetical protein
MKSVIAYLHLDWLALGILSGIAALKLVWGA